MEGRTAEKDAAGKSGNSSPTSARGCSPAQDDSVTVRADSASSSLSGDADTYSIEDMMTDYPEHLGRTYHKYKAGSYLYPNDDRELERMEYQWWLIKAAQNGTMFYAPVRNPQRILEVGTGKGIWVNEVAEQIFPDAEVTGIDLDIRGMPKEVAENVRFEQQDCMDEDWCREKGSIDFIYSQSMLGALQDFKQYLINARSYLTPGTGWIECCEPDTYPCTDDNTIPDNWPVTTWAQWQEHAAQKLGRPVRIAPKIKQWMIDCGYVDVEEVFHKIPIGTWPADKRLKRLGGNFRNLYENSLQTASMYLFTTALGWDEPTIHVFNADAKDAMRNRKVHSYVKCYIVYGRRPTVEEEKEMGRMAPPPPPLKNKTNLKHKAQAKPVP